MFHFIIRFLDLQMSKTPCPSAPVGCAPVASPVDNFAEGASLIPNHASPANK